MKATLQHIFSESFGQYAQGRKLPLKHHKAAQAIARCRTPIMGGHVYICPQDHEQHIQYHSCKHRSCPLCNALPKAQWVSAQKRRMLDCDHYHVIFTLPHELLDIWRYNSRWLANQLFQTCRDTLITLLKDNRHLGALPGILMALHTWGRTLSLHPHLHCLVTGGGLDAEGQWQTLAYDYLLPIEVVKRLFQGKLLTCLWKSLQAGELQLPPWQREADIRRLLRKLNDKSWNVRIQERYKHGNGVMLYLARYIKGGAINNQRITSVTPHSVTFHYKDHHDNAHKQLKLRKNQFIDRVLWHVPETGQHTVRQYGLYAHHGRAKRNRCRHYLGQDPENTATQPISWQYFLKQIGQNDKGNCSQCGQALLRSYKIGAPRWQDKNSINKWAAPVQQYVQPNPAPGFVRIRGPT